jgi:CheY-like chemotaxis protein
LQAIQIFKDRLQLCEDTDWDIKPYKIIFMDFNMPECDGPGAVKQIRKDFDEFMKEYPIFHRM